MHHVLWFSKQSQTLGQTRPRWQMPNLRPCSTFGGLCLQVNKLTLDAWSNWNAHVTECRPHSLPTWETAAFTGPLLANAFLAVFRSNMTFESSIRDIMRTIVSHIFIIWTMNSSRCSSHFLFHVLQGQEIPTTIAASWLNWIILRFTFLLPLNYLLNINAFIFHWLGMNCCSRMVRGGGPGGPVPYRVYVDSCMVILCLLALAPASPLIAPACLLYFLLCQPIFRCKQLATTSSGCLE